MGANFNSIMVRLRHRIVKRFIRCNLFQFQYGAIKTRPTVSKSISKSNFNSIMVRLRPAQRASRGCSRQDFNSIMVRLRLLSSFSENFLLVSYFNSIMVRLRLSGVRCDMNVVSFQFHYGAIKTYVVEHKGHFAQPFQFHYGAIKTARMSVLLLKHNTFQFHYGAIKTDKERYDLADYSKFQFHYGAIRTRWHRPPSCIGESISIPLWCD